MAANECLNKFNGKGTTFSKKYRAEQQHKDLPVLFCSQNEDHIKGFAKRLTAFWTEELLNLFPLTNEPKKK